MKKLLKSKTLYVVLGIFVVVIAVNGFLSRIREFNSQIEQYTTGYNIEVKDAEEYIDDFVYEPPKNIILEEPESEKTESVSVSVPIVQIMLPLQGELLAEHSNDELIYNKTMEDWRIHNGIDIAAEIGTAVKAAADGRVVKVGYDGMDGFVVEINHESFVTKYCGLQESELLKIDTEVKQGEVIGGVGTTIETEASETPHLHFELIKDGKSVNPLEYVENNVL